MNVRHWVCTLVGLLGLALVIFLTPRLTFEPKGMILPAKALRKALPADQVKIYQTPPLGDIQRLGEVRAELAFTQPTQAVKDRLLNSVKQMAASMGANGVVVQLFVENDGMRNVFTFVGTAIYAHSSVQ